MEEPDPPVPPSARTALPTCEKVVTECGSVVRVSRVLLESLVKSHSLITLDYTPLETFAKEQSVRLVRDVLRRLDSMVLSLADVKEHVENIVASFKLYRDRYSLEGAAMAMRCLRSFIIAVSDLCYMLELTEGSPPTNWDECTNMCGMQLRQLHIQSAFKAIEFVPDIADFQTVRVLGGGGFGVVYEALHTPTDTRVCIKLIIINRHKRLSHAALDKIFASVSEHPNLVMYFTSFLTSVAYVSVMEYAGGVDVLKFIIALGEVTPNHYGVILKQMVKAVIYMHTHGFIHRDIKPQNAVLLPGGHVKLIDFDTCKICAGHFVDARHLTGYFNRTSVEFDDKDHAGTLSFMSPEVIEHKPYGRAVDWWAMGVTAYRLIVGKMPFRHKSHRKLKIIICHAEYRFPEAIPAQEREFIEGLLTKDIQCRLGSRNYDELIDHQLFADYSADKPIEESYFDTTKLLESLQETHKKQSKDRKDVNEKKYVKLQDCTNVPLDEQKSLMVFASVAWRTLTRGNSSICPEKSPAEIEHDLEALLEVQDIITSEAVLSSFHYSESSMVDTTGSATRVHSSLFSTNKINDTLTRVRQKRLFTTQMKTEQSHGQTTTKRNTTKKNSLKKSNKGCALS